MGLFVLRGQSRHLVWRLSSSSWSSLSDYNLKCTAAAAAAAASHCSLSCRRCRGCSRSYRATYDRLQISSLSLFLHSLCRYLSVFDDRINLSQRIKMNWKKSCCMSRLSGIENTIVYVVSGWCLSNVCVCVCVGRSVCFSIWFSSSSSFNTIICVYSSWNQSYERGVRAYTHTHMSLSTHRNDEFVYITGWVLAIGVLTTLASVDVTN